MTLNRPAPLTPSLSPLGRGMKRGIRAMSDISQLEQQILGDISGAGDETALEAVRVAALGKSGSVSALLRTLGALTPDERKQQGPLINGLKERVTEALG